MNLKLGLAQITPRLGHVAANLQMHLDHIARAAEEGVQLLLFPELSLTGYNLQDLVYELALHPTPDNATFRALLNAGGQHAMDLTVGFVEEDDRNRFFISQAYLSEGEVVHVHRKVYLPTYGLFDEGRYFAWGDSIRAFDTRFGRVGMLICEDFWHASPPYLLWLDGADVLLMHSASPGRGLDEGEQLSSARWVNRVSLAYASLFTNYVIHCNRCGFEDGLNFWGGSIIVDPNGEMLLRGPEFEDAFLTHTIDLNQLHRSRSRLPLLRDERTGLMARELSRILGQDGHGGR
jgi:NAD+ synthase (glutamine-hydrolysing)